MAKNNLQKNRQIGKKKVDTAFNPYNNKKFRSFVYSVLFILALIIFFIVNNTRSVPEKGPYPPNYNADSARKYLVK